MVLLGYNDHHARNKGLRCARNVSWLAGLVGFIDLWAAGRWPRSTPHHADGCRPCRRRRHVPLMSLGSKLRRTSRIALTKWRPTSPSPIPQSPFKTRMLSFLSYELLHYG